MAIKYKHKNKKRLSFLRAKSLFFNAKAFLGSISNALSIRLIDLYKLYLSNYTVSKDI
jgi:hypothetical protein